MSLDRNKKPEKVRVFIEQESVFKNLKLRCLGDEKKHEKQNYETE